MNIRKCFCISMIVMISVILAPGIVSAAHISMSDDDTNGVTVTPDNNFEFGFALGPATFKDVSFTGTWIVNVGANGSGIIYFVAPATTTLMGILDVTFTSTNPGGFGRATINGRFETDQCGVLASGRTIPAGFPVVEEVAGSVGVLGLFRDPGTGIPVSLPSNLTMSMLNDLIVTACAVGVDIKPGSCPNPFNSKKKGVMPVAIIGTDTFDVTDVKVNPLTAISLTGTLGSVSPVAWEILDSTEPDDGDPAVCDECFDASDPANFTCDLWDTTDPNNPVYDPGVDGVLDSYCGDDYPDLILYFDNQDLAALAIGAEAPGSCVELTLTGELLDGTHIIGSDSVIIRK